MNAMPFITGVLKASDPYRNDPSFTEAPPHLPGNLVTYEDADGDGFYTPGSDSKFLLGPAEIMDDVRRATAVSRASLGASSEPAWEGDFRLEAAGTRRLARLTRRLLGQRLAIVVDRLVASAATVQGGRCG